VNQVRDLLECAWPTALEASGAPFRSATWRAAVAVALDRGHGDLTRVRRLGIDRFTAALTCRRPSLPRRYRAWPAIGGSCATSRQCPWLLKAAGLSGLGWGAVGRFLPADQPA
jgi:hypothetical protein